MDIRPLMKINKHLVIGLCTIIVLSMIGMFSISQSTPFNTDASVEAKPANDFKIRVLNCTIVSISNTSVVVESSDFRGELVAKGKWFFICNDSLGLEDWSQVSGYVKEGLAQIAVVFNTSNGTGSILLTLKQGDLRLFRYQLIKWGTIRKLSTRNYFGVYGKILYKSENFLVVNIRGYRTVVFIGAESKWRKAGDGIVTWKEVSREFREGDTIRIFCHNIVFFKDTFARYVGFRALIWGYSGAIIDLTSGVSISRYVGE